MSVHRNNVTLSLLYADNSSRAYTFENVADDDLIHVKAKVKAINKNANNDYADFYKTFISSDGAKVIRIDAARILSVEEEVTTDSSAKKQTNTVTYINPDATNDQIREFAQKIIALTTDTYLGVTKVTKESVS